MALCSVADVRAYANPESVSDEVITGIIQRISIDVLTKAESTDESNNFLIQAVIHGSAALTLNHAITNGELAASVETPEYKQSNTGLIGRVNAHNKEMADYIQRYRDSIRYKNYALLYARVGLGTIDAELR
jgi:hypothetical protein